MPDCLQTKCGQADGGQRPILKPHLSNQAKNVTSMCSITRKTAPPTAAMLFDRSGPFANSSEIYIKPIFSPSYMKIGHKIFKLDRDFIGTKLLTKFHEDRTINVASRMFTNKCGQRSDGRTEDRQRPVTKAHLSNQGVGTAYGLGKTFFFKVTGGRTDGPTDRQTDRQTVRSLNALHWGHKKKAHEGQSTEDGTEN
ncbi:hypothetical protein DPMN_075846 [Dreissena polymorpha]|uniref:Uncharacterized protein n=1 Tax=Dreissena polymorpha TaxID=45954 RepID=A0A9D3YL67_DREPO|nr:hypothetical protein DPMN_075846 [Dreissena polymorpha]